jgi:hypothetical protein
MVLVDSPISRLRGRTPRELLILGALVFFIASGLLAPRPPWWDLSIFAIALVGFATRFWAARILGLGICVSSLAMALVHVREGQWDLTALMPHQLSFAATWLAGLVILSGADLGRRFERAPSWTPFGRALANPYARLPGLHLAAIAAGAVSLGALAHLLLRATITAQHHGLAATELIIPMVAIAATLLLLVAGRVVGLIAAAGVSSYLAIALGTKLCAAKLWLAWPPSPCNPATDSLAYHPGVVYVGFGLALIGAAVTVPYAVIAAKKLARHRRA